MVQGFRCCNRDVHRAPRLARDGTAAALSAAFRKSNRSGRLRGLVGVLLAQALCAPGRRRCDRRSHSRCREAREGRGNGPLGHVSAKAGRHSVGPADASVIEKRASLFDYAVLSGCEQPLIALNELWGASLPTPLTPTAERTARTSSSSSTDLQPRRPSALLVSSRPFTAGDAAAWWKSVAAVSDLVLENYANANLILARWPGSRFPTSQACAIGSLPRSSSRSASRPPASGSQSASRRFEARRSKGCAALALVQRGEMADTCRASGRA